MALQGTLDTFALPDVLRLLAATKKTGRLRITGGRGTGSVWVSSGEVEAIEATHAPHASEAVDALFELLRFEEGAFTFDAEARHDEPGQPTDVELLLAHSEAMLSEWREIEVVVPSMDAWVTLRRTLPLPEIAVDQACWTTIVAIGAGATVRRIGDELCLAELPISRAVKELSEVGLIEIAAAAPAGALASTNGHAPLARPLVAAKAKELREPEVPPPPATPRPRRPKATEDAPAQPEAFRPLDLPGHGVTASYDTDEPVVEPASTEVDDLAKQLATLSPRAANAIRAAAEATTDEEREAALDEVDADDDTLNRGLLLKFLSSVKT